MSPSGISKAIWLDAKDWLVLTSELPKPMTIPNRSTATILSTRLLAPVLIAALPFAAAAQSVFAPVADTFLETGNRAPSVAHGAPGDEWVNELFAYNNTGDFRAWPLLKFDLSSLAGTVVPQDAVLSLYVGGSLPGRPARVLDLFSVTAPFNEQTASYSNFESSTFGALITSATVTPVDGQRLSITIPAATVQQWINTPSNNFGFIIKPNVQSGEPSADIYFKSKEAGAATQPTLAVVPEPSVAALGALGALGLLRRGRRRTA